MDRATPVRPARRRLRLAGRIAGGALLLIVLAAAALLIYLSAHEYRPDAEEPAWTAGQAQDAVPRGGSVSLLTFNIGYAALGEESDFFMDGGASVRPSDPAVVEKNLAGIVETVEAVAPDIAMLQEVDVSGKRSYDIDERAALHASFGGAAAFAPNFLCDYVPYPIPDTIGPVHSGLLTLSRFRMEGQTRVALPVPFAWPVRMANLKRCLLVTRLPVEGTEAELVLVNLHLEAYDGGEGKRAQTERLTELLVSEYEAGNYVVAGGDFNQRIEGVGEAYPVVDASYWQPGELARGILPEGWTFAFANGRPTCRLLNEPYDADDPLTQYYVIDGFLCSPNVTVDSVEVIDGGLRYADHNPVLLRFTLG